MNIRIQRAADPLSLDREVPEASFSALPEGFPFAVDSTGHVIEPILGFLSERFLTRTTRKLLGYSPASVSSAAYELADYWRYLDHEKKAWDEIDVPDIERYRDTMHRQISEKTQLEYSPATIAHRISTVLAFYTWGAKHEHTALMTNVVRRIGPSDRPRRDSKVVALPKPSCENAVRVLQIDEYRSVAARLGPLPSQKNATRPTRDRLIAELALQTGARRAEIAALTINQILALTPDRSRPYGVTPLRLTVTKGGTPRSVFVPNWLASDLVWYIEHERSKAKPVRRRVSSKLRAENILFVGHPWARQHAGLALSPTHLDRLYHRAVMSASLVRTVVKTDPTTGVQRVVQQPRHTFHGLRHTFAVWTYYARRMSGDAEPWKYIQAALGHRALETTLNLYLRAAADFEAVVSDRLMKQMKIMRHLIHD